MIGVELAFDRGDNTPVIAPGGAGSLNLTWQLRATHRGDGSAMAPTATPIVNIAGTQLDSPGRIACPGTACSTGATTAQDDFKIVEAGYAITTNKRINPATVNENGSNAYTSTLTAQPVGNARTTLMTVTDFAPTFWNTMDYVSSSVVVPSAVNQVKMDLLISGPATGAVTYEVVGGTLVALCDGVAVVATSPCIVEGRWVDAPAGTRVNFVAPTLDAGAEIVGVQYQARRVVGGVPVQWERPSNPRLDITLRTERREFLRSEPTTLVSTTRPGLAPNPGETEPGVISNSLVSTGNAQFGPNQSFTDTQLADASTKVLHVPNAIKVTKTRGTTNTVNPAGPINFIMTVENTGRWDMTGFKVTDQIGLIDGSSPLVEPMPRGYTFAITGAGAPAGNAGFSASLNETTPEAELELAKSIKFVTEFANPDATVPGPGLHPGETLQLTFNTRTPFLLPADGADPAGTPVAYNSFAGSSRAVATPTQPERAELVLEPQRVGIATATGQLNLKKIVEAPTFALGQQGCGCRWRGRPGWRDHRVRPGVRLHRRVHLPRAGDHSCRRPKLLARRW